jgi:hypothetical protein
MLPALYIRDNGETEIRDGAVVFTLPKGFTSSTPFNRNIKLIEIGKSMDTFNYNNPLLVAKIKNKIESLYNFDNPLKFVINFAVEESELTNDIVKFYREILHKKPILFLTNNINYLGEENFILYNTNQWTLDNCETEFIHSLYTIKKNDLGTIKKKFMFLNNHFSETRFNILKLIYKLGKQSEGNISFNLINFNDTNVGIESEESFNRECEEYSIEYPKHYDTYPGLSQISEVEVQRKKILGINHIGTVALNYRIYFECFFEIITETHHLLRMQGTYLSEKIHKSLKAGNPFIYYGKKEVKQQLEKMGFTFNSPIYFFGEGDEFMNHLETILNKDIEWYNDIQRQYLSEYIANVTSYKTLQLSQSDKIIKYLYS